jgi:hypothetical protein
MPPSGGTPEGQKAREDFFFEKKKQKTSSTFVQVVKMV